MLWFRLILVWWRARRARRIGLLDASDLKMRVWPTDLDFNLHMNNARYLAVMDLGRIDLLVRTGVVPVALAQGWKPMLGGAVLRFRRQLRPFARYRLTSRVLCWDQRWIYLEHRLDGQDGMAALAGMRGAFVGPKGIVPPAEIMEALGAAGPSPATPDWIAAWAAIPRPDGVD